MLSTEIYSGKLSKNEKNTKNVGEKTVLSLASKYYNSNRHLPFDNFFFQEIHCYEANGANKQTSAKAACF